ncbi:MAG: peptide-methionine (S)-S-oxide reductase [Candidatus Nitrosotenuis sp.]
MHYYVVETIVMQILPTHEFYRAEKCHQKYYVKCGISK